MRRVMLLVLALFMVLGWRLGALTEGENVPDTTQNSREGNTDVPQSEDYFICVYDDGNIIASLDSNCNVYCDPSYLHKEKPPQSMMYQQLITALKREDGLKDIGTIYLASQQSLAKVEGDRYGVFFDPSNYLVVVCSENENVLVQPDDNDDLRIVLEQYFTYLGAALVLSDNLGMDIQPYMIMANGQDDYVYLSDEQNLFRTLYAQLGRDYAWIGRTELTVDMDSYVSWFQALTTMRVFAIGETASPNATDLISPIVTSESIWITMDLDNEVNYITITTEDQPFEYAFEGGLKSDSVEDLQLIIGYIRALSILNGYDPDHLDLHALYKSSAGMFILDLIDDRDFLEDTVDQWLSFGKERKATILENSTN